MRISKPAHTTKRVYPKLAPNSFWLVWAEHRAQWLYPKLAPNNFWAVWAVWAEDGNTGTKQFVAALGSKCEVHKARGRWSTQSYVCWWVFGVVWCDWEEERARRMRRREWRQWWRQHGLWLGCNTLDGSRWRKADWLIWWLMMWRGEAILVWSWDLSHSWGRWVPNGRERWVEWWTRTLWTGADSEA